MVAPARTNQPDTVYIPEPIRQRFTQVLPTEYTFDTLTGPSSELSQPLEVPPTAAEKKGPVPNSELSLDDHLVAAKDGNNEARNVIAKEIFRIAYGKARQIGLRIHDAEDVAQTVAAAVSQKVPRITSIDHLTFYTIRSATNKAWNLLGSKSKKIESPVDDEYFDSREGREEDPAEVVAGDSSPGRDEQRTIVARAMESLSPLHRKTIELSLSGKPAAELAPLLGIKPSNYYVTLCRAKKELMALIHGTDTGSSNVSRSAIGRSLRSKEEPLKCEEPFEPDSAA